MQYNTAVPLPEFEKAKGRSPQPVLSRRRRFQGRREARQRTDSGAESGGRWLDSTRTRRCTATRAVRSGEELPNWTGARYQLYDKGGRIRQRRHSIENRPGESTPSKSLQVQKGDNTWQYLKHGTLYILYHTLYTVHVSITVGQHPHYSNTN